VILHRRFRERRSALPGQDDLQEVRAPVQFDLANYPFRLEEMILVGRNGAEFLTNFDRELFGP